MLLCLNICAISSLILVLMVFSCVGSISLALLLLSVIVFVVLNLLAYLRTMTRIFSRDTTSLSEGIQIINMTVKDKGRIIAMFSATFTGDVLSSFFTINMDLPLSFIGQETTRFMARAYSIITGLDAGYIEFELCQDL